VFTALYHKLLTQSSAPEDGRNYRPKHVELIEIINKIVIVASSWLFILLYYTIIRRKTSVKSPIIKYCQNLSCISRLAMCGRTCRNMQTHFCTFWPTTRRNALTFFLLYCAVSHLTTERISTLYVTSFPRSQLLLYVAGIAQYCN